MSKLQCHLKGDGGDLSTAQKDDHRPQGAIGFQRGLTPGGRCLWSMEPEAPPEPCQPLWEASQKLSTCLSPGTTARARESRGHSQRLLPALLSAPSLPPPLLFHVLTTGSHPSTCCLPDGGMLSVGLLEPRRPCSGGRPPKLLSVTYLFLVK